MLTEKYTKADRDKQAALISEGRPADGADNMDEVGFPLCTVFDPKLAIALISEVGKADIFSAGNTDRVSIPLLTVFDLESCL